LITHLPDHHHDTEQFFQQLETSIAKYDLLCHPFYKLGPQASLTREDLRAYAKKLHTRGASHLLAELAVRLEEKRTAPRRPSHMADEKAHR